jgi:hypothetical protein
MALSQRFYEATDYRAAAAAATTALPAAADDDDDDDDDDESRQGINGTLLSGGCGGQAQLQHWHLKILNRDGFEY